MNCDSHIKPWNVSGQMGNMASQAVGRQPHKGHSHIPRGHRASMLAACHLAVLSGILLGVDAWMPGSTVVQGDTAPGKARAVGAVYGGGCRASEKILLLGRGEASRAWEQGKTLELQCLDSGPARCVAGSPPATRFGRVLGEGDWVKGSGI